MLLSMSVQGFFFLLLRKQHGLRVFENNVLRVIFEPRREDVRDGRRKLHKNSIQNFDN